MLLRRRPRVLCIRHRSFWWKDKETDRLTDIEKENSVIIDANSTLDSTKSLVPQFKNVVNMNPVLTLPIIRRPLFPGFVSFVNVRDPTTINAIQSTWESGTPFIGLFLRSDSSTPEIHVEMPEIITSVSQLCKVGTFSQISNIVKNESGTHVQLIGHRRITLEQLESMGPPIMSKVIHWKAPSNTSKLTPTLKGLIYHFCTYFIFCFDIGFFL